jgi:MFS transporter, ACS family, solute carrier family 17 (sodium-dependent inorganic phosphate cotransporter), other
MGFLAVVNAYTMRICLNIAITKMVFKNKTTDENGNQDFSGQCIPPNSTSIDDELNLAEFEWAEDIQGLILGAFFIGYFL